jgi:hypothetical protein
VQAGQELGRHSFPIYNDLAHPSRFDALFILCDEQGQPDRQMLIPTVGGDQQGMSLLIVKQYQRTAPKDRTQAPHQHSGNAGIGVDGLAMVINSVGERCTHRRIATMMILQTRSLLTISISTSRGTRKNHFRLAPSNLTRGLAGD